MSTVSQALAAAVARLREAGVPDPARDARRLLADAMGVAPDRLALHMPDPFPDAAAPRWQAHLDARAARQPVSQIIGQRLFHGRCFRVTPAVLDPRPETERLIEAALASPAQRILDIGTGSGCILLTLLAEWPMARGLGTDRSAAALTVARANATALGLDGRAGWLETDWADGAAGPFDLIVSNPPYIAAHELAGLMPEVAVWEPAMALSPGVEGLESYRALIPQAAGLLAPGGRLMMEIGPTQAGAVTGLCHAAGLGRTTILRDLDGRDRVVAATR